MSARSRMTMRATVERDGTTTTDGFGLPDAPTWTSHLRELPCWVSTKREREIIDGSKIAILADHRMMVPLGTDITEEDRVTAIKDRRGTTLIGNTMRVGAVIRRFHHLECRLEEVD